MEEEAPWNRWPLARVIHAEKDDDRLIRKAKLMVGDRQITEQGSTIPLRTIERPIHKLVLLMQGEERPGIPAEEPSDD